VEWLDARASEEGKTRCGVPDKDPERDARRSDLRRGWCWGSQAFAERMLNLGDAVLSRPRHRSANASGEKRAHGEQRARRLLAEGLAVAASLITNWRISRAASHGKSPSRVSSGNKRRWP